VTAGRASAEAEAINVERTADNLLQVMPNEIITSLPNANLADALGRLPSVTLERDEGEGKYVHVRSTEPRLTNTTGDGIGGSVNLVTKTATDTPAFEVTGLGGYTPIIHGRGNTTETATFGQRF